MVAGWLRVTAVAWLAVSFVCALVILIDLVRGHRQKMAVMNVVWPITALYYGVFGVWAYWRMGRRGAGGSERPFWQSVFMGATHCGAGCTLGDLIAEWIVFLAGFTVAGSVLMANFVWDFSLAFLVGIAFQYASIVPMRGLTWKEGVKEAVKADSLSLTAFEVGMFIWMGLVNKVFFHPALRPDDATYWFMMQVAMVVGFWTAFPANWFLIRKGIKSRM